MDRSDGGRSSAVLAIECLAASSKGDEWAGGEVATLQAGDIVNEITFEGTPPARAPFKGGRPAVMKLFHQAYKRGDTSVVVKARRGHFSDHALPTIEYQARVVPHPTAGRRQYALRSLRDPNFVVGFVDRSEAECIALQGSRSSRVVCALSNAQLQDGYVIYPWEKKMKELLPMPNSSSFLSLFILPKASDDSGTRFNSFDDTLARANAWLSASQAAGVPISFVTVQSESLLTKISGETASSTVNMGSLADLSNMVNVSLYGFEDYHGVDIGLVRAVRLWYSPIGGERRLEIKLHEGDIKLGFAISRTEEGFIYISSVVDEDGPGIAATRSGLRDLYKGAARASKLLVVSRIGNEKVLPRIVSTSGAIRCFDTVSLSQKLSLHRHALKPIVLHLLIWDSVPPLVSKVIKKYQVLAPAPIPAAVPAAAPAAVVSIPRTPLRERASLSTPRFLPPSPVDEILEDLVYRPASDAGLQRDNVGDVSFRFNDFSIMNSNWV